MPITLYNFLNFLRRTDSGSKSSLKMFKSLIDESKNRKIFFTNFAFGSLYYSVATEIIIYLYTYIGLIYTYRDLVYRSFGRCSEHLALMNIHDFRWLQAHRPSFPCCTHFCPASSAPFNNLYICIYKNFSDRRVKVQEWSTFNEYLHWIPVV